MNCRMQLFDWLAMHFPMPRRVKRNKKKANTPAKPSRWWYETPDGHSGMATAFTRSHVRAGIKRTWNLKGRVPIGTVIEKVE